MINYADKYKEMSDKWLIKRRRYLLKPGAPWSLPITLSDEAIDAILTEADAIEAILENREDKRLDYAAAAQSWGG